ncbi:MAG: hypothetical protein EBR09_05430 [Proteobacteria bacterium]|nr:hypothetical protein [Pseudomonadota bacterium]
MRVTTAFACSVVCLSAHAGTTDQFQCRFNLKRGPQTQAFQLKQKITVERKALSYSVPEGRQIAVTQAEIPFEVYLGWDKFTAKITYRHALESLGQGIFRAARWKCFESVIETPEGVESFSCGDRQRTDDPFADANQRWLPAQVINNSPAWGLGDTFQEQFEVGADLLTLNCAVVQL